MAQQTWTILSTTLENDRVKVSSSYTVDGTNALTTFTQSNLTGREKLVDSSANSILDSIFYSIDSNGFIDYYIKDAKGDFKKYGSIQEIADGGFVAYNSKTTELIKNYMQGSLEAAADTANIPKNESNPNNSVNNDGNNVNNGLDADRGGEGNDETNGSTPISADLLPLTIEGAENKPTGKFKYPENIGSASARNLDRIKFVQSRYVGLNVGGNVSLTRTLLTERQYSDYTDSNVVIGIQPTISDSNQVRWNGGNLDQIRGSAAALSLSVINSDGFNAAGKTLFDGASQLLSDLGGNDQIAKSLNTYFAGKAVGVGGQLLSRVNGAVLNPNLELLFEGPTLRSFNYTFKMSAENFAEAQEIKNIIRWFKKGMAVKKASEQLFLTAPNVFKIKYIKGENSENDHHDSINKLKYCALLDAKVNYTPEGNYSTYSDGTMSMYELSLSFGEINPIYAEDYNDNHPIGY